MKAFDVYAALTRQHGRAAFSWVAWDAVSKTGWAMHRSGSIYKAKIRNERRIQLDYDGDAGRRSVDEVLHLKRATRPMEIIRW